MVLPSKSKRSRKPRRDNNTDILVVIAVTAIAVSAAWILTLKLLGRFDYPPGVLKHDTFAPPATKKSGGDAVVHLLGQEVEVDPGAFETGGEMHLSASKMLATARPYIMYGTAWKKDATSELVFEAAHAGFRFFDTACQPKHYDEAGVGYGVKTAYETMGLKREDFFLQTKFTSVAGQDPNNLPYMRDSSLVDQVRQSVHASLRNLQTDYIDSLLLHSPMPTMDETMIVWRALEEYVNEGKIKQLGISNCYKPTKLRQLYDQAEIKPVVLQNRFYKDSNFDIELRQMCSKLGIQYQSFWTLSANRRALATQEWKGMAEEKRLTPQTLMYAFMMSLGHTPLSGTKSSEHMEQDVDLMLRFQRGEEILNDDERELLSSLLGI